MTSSRWENYLKGRPELELPVHQQLKVISIACVEMGWSRLNGNTWGADTWSLQTGYTNQEATITVRSTMTAPSRMDYRGPKPLKWLLTPMPSEEVYVVPYRFVNELRRLLNVPAIYHQSKGESE